jgi:hypothetical protein
VSRALAAPLAGLAVAAQRATLVIARWGFIRLG